MPLTKLDFKSAAVISSRTLKAWRIAQWVVWVIGAFILFSLLFFPSLGIVLFWNILIPMAPALFVFGIGIWRNVCPLATTNLLPRHLNLSKRKRLSVLKQGQLNLIAVLALYAIVPLRHAVFNNSGIATALLIISMAVAGVIMGFFYEWKSAWCSGLCPVHPVEKLYGGNVTASVPNAHCDLCRNCVIPCPDSIANIDPGTSGRNIYQQVSGFLIAGGLPGFIWGWFHVPDENSITSLQTFLYVYKLPLTGMALTLFLYAALLAVIRPEYEQRLTGVFAAAGVSCYYWFRIPALFGFGMYGNDGLLFNLTGILPAWCIVLFTTALTVLFSYWLVIRKKQNKSWVIRPPYANKKQATTA